MESDSTSRLLKKHRRDLRKVMPQELRRRILGELFTPERKPTMIPWLSFGGGAVAAMIALMLTFQMGRMTSRESAQQIVLGEVVSSHVRSLMATHLSDVISTDQHTVKPWFEGKIDFGPTVRDFAQDGFPLIGGRLDYIDGRSTAALIYKSNQHVINIFEQPSVAPQTETPHLTTLRGYQIFSWSRDGMNFWAVSDLNATDLQRFVELWLK